MPVRYLKRGEAQESTITALQEALEISAFTARLLSQRGVATVDEAKEFFQPLGGAFHDPFLLTGMAEAVRLVRQAVAEEKTILIYGDYDVDGVMATSLLCSYLRSQHAHVRWYVPSRHSEGYGLNKNAISRECQGVDLLISVDCGISNAEEVALAREMGVAVIITDHHQCPDDLPDANTVINPHQPGDTYPFKDLCGAGVAAKLVQALGGEAAFRDYLDMTALATVADLVPLTGENRTIVKQGMEALKKPRVGMKALLDEAGLNDKNLSAGRLAFTVAPRINAGGRMDLSGKSIELMLSDDPAFAMAVASELSADNANRQAQEQQILTQAEEQLARDYDFARQRCIVLYRPDWNTGVIGIVASRLAEKYTRPVLLFGDGEGMCYGSGRSVPGIDLYRCLKAVSRFFVRYGGHEQAGGCATTADCIPPLREAMDTYFKENYADEFFFPYQYYDAELSPEEINAGLCAELEKCEPFGIGNPKPAALFVGQQAADVKELSGGKHLRFRLEHTQVQCVAFSQGYLKPGVEKVKFDLTGLPQIDTYFPKNPRLQILTEHIRLQQSEELPDETLWLDSLLAQAALPEGEGEVIELAEEDWKIALREETAASPWGTAGLVFGPEGLAPMRAGAFKSVVRAGLIGAAPGENAVIYAPIPEELPLGQYGKLFISGLFWRENASYLASLLKRDGVCYIIKNNTFSGNTLLKGMDLSRTAMGERYAFLKRQAAAYHPTQMSQLSTPPMRIAIRVFAELGLLEELQETIPYRLLTAAGKRELTQSRTYRRLLEVQNR